MEIASQYTPAEIAEAQKALDTHPKASPFWDTAMGQDTLDVIIECKLTERSTEYARRKYHNACMRGARLGDWADECEHESELMPDGNGAYCVHCGETLS